MRTKDRLAVVHHYEWSVTRWFTSPTREALDAAGRGIYRELLDVCYTQGSIPSNHAILARMCRASDEEFERAWKFIGGHFRKHPKDPSALINSHANVFRNDYFRYIREQRSRGASGGRPKGNSKPHEISDEETTGLSIGKVIAKKCKSQHDTTRHDTIEHDTTRASQDSSVISGIAGEVPPALIPLRESLRAHGEAIGKEPDLELIRKIAEASQNQPLTAAAWIGKTWHRRFSERAVHRQPAPESLAYWLTAVREEAAGGWRS